MCLRSICTFVCYISYAFMHITACGYDTGGLCLSRISSILTKYYGHEVGLQVIMQGAQTEWGGCCTDAG
jgi:hypothetical protein